MRQVAEELTAKDVIRAHARDELGALKLQLPPCSCIAPTGLPSHSLPFSCVLSGVLKRDIAVATCMQTLLVVACTQTFMLLT